MSSLADALRRAAGRVSDSSLLNMISSSEKKLEKEKSDKKAAKEQRKEHLGDADSKPAQKNKPKPSKTTQKPVKPANTESGTKEEIKPPAQAKKPFKKPVAKKPTSEKLNQTQEDKVIKEAAKKTTATNPKSDNKPQAKAGNNKKPVKPNRTVGLSPDTRVKKTPKAVS